MVSVPTEKGKTMTDRERLLEILNVPIYPHENVDPLEAVADYLLDNGVTIPVRCAKCKHYNNEFGVCEFWHGARRPEHYCGEGVSEDNG